MSGAAVRASRTPARGLALPGRGNQARAVLPPRLRVVSAPAHTRSRAGLVALCGVLLAGALVSLLVLNVALEQGTYTLRRQQSAAARLTETRDALTEQLAALAAPQSLARQAQQLGMVPAGGVAFVKAGGSVVLGTAAPGRSPAPAVTTPAAPKTSPKPAAPKASPKPVTPTATGRQPTPRPSSKA